MGKTSRQATTGTADVKIGMAKMLKGGVIMGVFVGSGIFKSEDPEKRAKAIVRAVAHYSDPKVLLETSTNLGKAMVGISDVKGDAVNFRDREGGAKEATSEGIPKKRKLHGHTETQLYGSSWK